MYQNLSFGSNTFEVIKRPQKYSYVLIFRLRHFSYIANRKEWNGQNIGSDGDLSGLGMFPPILSCTVS
jgi:hypothetical protein